MRLKLAMGLALLTAGFFAVAPRAVAQEGHPLSGSWYGEWGKDAEQVTFIMKWDDKERDKGGKVVTDPDGKERPVIGRDGKPVFAVRGMFNPGPNSSIATMTLDSAKWMVHIETDYKDDDGKVTHIVADGKLETMGSYNRTIKGTWTQGNAKGDFKLRRD
ncbi:MAG TPA: hypothetical protein VFY29_14040 [Terriglobia bacterium]|nr:hypothetical protein [Terriglobia bacterium]